jgi:hypothetical protein
LQIRVSAGDKVRGVTRENDATTIGADRRFGRVRIAREAVGIDRHEDVRLQSQVAEQDVEMSIELARDEVQTSGGRRNLTCLSLVELLAVAPSG